MYDSYSYPIGCDNCKHTNNLIIPKGISVESHLKNYLCGNCGIAPKNPVVRWKGIEASNFSAIKDTGGLVGYGKDL